MKILLFATTVALAIGHDPPPTVIEDSQFNPHDDNSLLLGLLQQAGFSQSCVASALDQCSSTQEGHLASFMEEIKGMVQQIILLLKTWIFPPRHCKDLLDSGDRGRGVRQVYPNPGRPHQRVTMYCDHTVDGGGWTVLQRRSIDSRRQDFDRTFVEYQLGFGDIEGEFWLGLDLMHELTSTTMQELRVDLEDYNRTQRWAKYGFFHVGSQDTNYRLSIGRYSGDAGNAMEYANGMGFSTHDALHDTSSSFNCGKNWRGGWWYKSCGYVNLNGYQHEGHYSAKYGEGITWYQWRGWWHSLRKTTMMVRPAF